MRWDHLSGNKRKHRKPERLFPDEELKEPVRPFADTFSAETILFLEGWMDNMTKAGWRTDPVTGKIYNINDEA